MQSSHPLYVASVIMMIPYESEGGTSSRLTTHECSVVQLVTSLPCVIAAWPLLSIVRKYLLDIFAITLVHLEATTYTSFPRL